MSQHHYYFEQHRSAASHLAGDFNNKYWGALENSLRNVLVASSETIVDEYLSMELMIQKCIVDINNELEKLFALPLVCADL